MYTRRIFLIMVCTSLGGLIKRKPKGKATSFETKPKKYPISLCLYYVCCRPTLSIIYQFLLLMCHSNGKSPFHSLYFLSIQWQRKRFTRQRTFCLLFSAVATTSEYQEYLDSIIICSLFSTIAANGKIYTWHDDQKKIAVWYCIQMSFLSSLARRKNAQTSFEMMPQRTKWRFRKIYEWRPKLCYRCKSRRRRRKKMIYKCSRNWRIRWIDPITLIGKRIVGATIKLLTSHVEILCVMQEIEFHVLKNLQFKSIFSSASIFFFDSRKP